MVVQKWLVIPNFIGKVNMVYVSDEFRFIVFFIILLCFFPAVGILVPAYFWKNIPLHVHIPLLNVAVITATLTMLKWTDSTGVLWEWSPKVFLLCATTFLHIIAGLNTEFCSKETIQVSIVLFFYSFSDICIGSYLSCVHQYV